VAALLALLLLCLPVRAAEVLGTYDTALHKVRAVVVAGGLRSPWALAFLPDGDFLVTEQNGRLLRLSADGEKRTEISGVPTVYAVNQGGLLDVAIAPDFAASRRIFLTYSAEGSGGGAHTNLASARLEEDRLEDLHVLFDGGPDERGGRHFGSRIVFLPDGTLAFTIGDRGQKDPAQDLMSHAGKVIRLNPDGSVPADNPFLGRDDARPEIYSYGHRNPQGMILHPASGMLWLHEHGPRGGDEVNIVEPGANYGWPLVSYGKNYSGTPVGTGNASGPGITEPIHTWVPSIAPSGMAYYNGGAFPQWRGSVFVGALKYQLLARLTLDGDRVTGQERLFARYFGRIRDVRQGPDGLLYLLTDEHNGRLIRLEPAD
jgi:glucose/arabinose dehydrogenase